MQVFIFDDGLLDSEELLVGVAARGIKYAVFGSISDLIEASEARSPDVIILVTAGSIPATKKLVTKLAEIAIVAVISDLPFENYGSQCLDAGADFFEEINKPVSETILKLMAVERGTHRSRSTAYRFKRKARLIGSSETSIQLNKLISKVSSSDASAFIWGPSGVGKEIVCKLIHSKSDRRDSPLLIRSCASFNLGLFEAEMFGYSKGAFTGALRDSKGLFELAEGGTLVLDEISELPLGLQAKLLRVLELGVYNKVGELSEYRSDVRVLTTSSKDPRELMARGLLREDLMFRLNTLEIRVPTLAERLVEIPELVKYFLPVGWVIKDEALKLLQSHDWPGNIRELKNAVEAACALADGEIEPKHIMIKKSGRPVLGKLASVLAKTESDVITEALETVEGNRTKAAKLLGISRANLIQKIKKLDVDA